VLVEGFQRPFATESISEEHREKVNDLIVAKATASKAHLFSESRKDMVLAKILHDQSNFSKPGWC